MGPRKLNPNPQKTEPSAQAPNPKPKSGALELTPGFHNLEGMGWACEVERSVEDGAFHGCFTGLRA